MNARVALRVDNHAQADFDAVVKCFGVGQAQVDATVAATPLVRLGVIEALVVLPGGVVEADHVALERHPVAHRALVFGLSGRGIFGTDERACAVVAVDLPHALRGCVLAGQARDKVGLPHDIAVLVVVARVLLGQVDVDIGLPIGLALGGKRVGLL